MSRQGGLTERRPIVLGAAVLVVASALGALWPYGGQKCGEAASEDTWPIQAKWETADPGAVPTKDAAGGDDPLSNKPGRGKTMRVAVQPDGGTRTEVMPIGND